MTQYKPKLTKAYFINIPLILCLGLIFAFVFSTYKDSGKLFVLILVGAILVTILSSICNLFYFYKLASLEIRLFLPGVLTTSICFFTTDEVLAVFSMVNLLLGMCWYYTLRTKKIKSQ